MKLLHSVVLLTFSLLVVPGLQAQTKRITTAEAKDHIGDKATVCGRVVSTHYAKNSKGEPTFLNLDEPYPKEVFTVLIWGSGREKFGVPESKYRDARVCVTGKITSYRGTAEIVATEPSQITMQ
jgi:DNA/RNA endonuclease YhcR with UshA esterase domain